MVLWKRVALTGSLASAMTGFALALFVVSSWLYEFIPNSRRGDDDWLWFLLPLGGAFGLCLWVRHRNRGWVHVCGMVLVLWLVASIAWILSARQPPGMEGLGIGLGKALAAALAYVAAATGMISFAIAGAVVVLLNWMESRQTSRR